MISNLLDSNLDFHVECVDQKNLMKRPHHSSVPLLSLFIRISLGCSEKPSSWTFLTGSQTLTHANGTELSPLLAVGKLHLSLPTCLLFSGRAVSGASTCPEGVSSSSFCPSSLAECIITLLSHKIRPSPHYWLHEYVDTFLLLNQGSCIHPNVWFRIKPREVMCRNLVSSSLSRGRKRWAVPRKMCSREQA